MTTSTQTQLRKGTTAQIGAMTPALAEVVIDTSLNQPCVGDGSTAGGIKVPTAKMIQNQNMVYPTVGGTANAITLTTQTNYTPVAAYAAGQKFVFKAASNNTGATTVNIDTVGAKNIKKMVNGSLADLSADDIVAGGIHEITYDGTQFQIALSTSFQVDGTTITETGGVISAATQLMTAGGVGALIFAWYDNANSLTNTVSAGGSVSASLLLSRIFNSSGVIEQSSGGADSLSGTWRSLQIIHSTERGFFQRIA